MTNFRDLEKECPAGIPISKCRELRNKKDKKTRKTNRRKLSKKNRRRRQTNKKKTKVPPKGVIIRKHTNLYKSTGKKLIKL